MGSATRLAIIMLVVGLIGLGATPARAEAQSSLLLLGMNRAGRLQPDLDNAVQLRLSGLGLAVVRPKAIHVSPCENTECMSRASTVESTDMVLVGHIQKNEHACIATLWLLLEKDKPPIQQDIVCLPGGTENELVELIANNAGELVESHLRGREPVPDLSRLCPLPKASEEVSTAARTKKRWSWQKKVAVVGLSALLTAGVAAAVGLSITERKGMDQFDIYGLSAISSVSAVSGAAAASLLLISIR